MIFNDFIYDGIKLSDLGYMVCSIGNEGSFETISNGSKLSLQTVSMRNGQRFDYVNYKYEECITGVAQIMKDKCSNTDMYFTKDELRYITKWLNRKGFHKCVFMDENLDYIDVHFNTSFNVNKIELGDKVIGLELEIQTDAPFGYGEKVENTYTSNTGNWSFYHNNLSDELGALYPKITFRALENGNLRITNLKEDRSTIIHNVKRGEVITMEYPIITTSDSSHTTIMNDFNWNFFRLTEDFEDALNEISVSLAGTITIEYEPIVKVSF